MIDGLEEQSFFTDLLHTTFPTLTFFLSSASNAAHSLLDLDKVGLGLP